jgi:hypothetical protein
LQYDGVDEFVWAAAGTWNDVFAIRPLDFVKAANGNVVELRR